MNTKQLGIYAWISTDKDGNQGIVASSRIVNNVLMCYPLITLDTKLALAMRGDAETIAEKSGYAVQLVKFAEVLTLQTFGNVEWINYAKLRGEHRHYCQDWDFMAIDEYSPEFEQCTCFENH